MSLVNDALKIVSEQMADGSEARLDMFGSAPVRARKSGVGSLFMLILIGAIAGPTVAVVLKPPAWLSRSEPDVTAAAPVVVTPAEVPAAPVVAPVIEMAQPAVAVDDQPRFAAGALPGVAAPEPVAPVPVVAEAAEPAPAPVPVVVTPPVAVPATAPAVDPSALVAGREYVQSVDAGSNTLTVTAIMASRFTQVAIVNSATVQAGQTIGDIEVLAIDPSRLTLRRGQTTFYLRMK